MASLSVFKRVWLTHFPWVKTPAAERFSKCTTCINCSQLINSSDDPIIVAFAEAKRRKHHARVSQERLWLEMARLESRRDPTMLFAEIDGMDSSKTLLPHMATWDKEVSKKDLLKMHLTCVKYNGTRPDDVYGFTDTVPHDSSCVITVMWQTILKDLERRGRDGPPLKKVWFQVDNTCRENKNRFMVCFAEWLVSTGVCEEVRLSFLPVG